MRHIRLAGPSILTALLLAIGALGWRDADAMAVIPKIPPTSQQAQVAALTSVTLYAATDAYVNQNSPNTSYGSSTILSVSRDEFMQETRALLRFTLSSIPVGSVINQARLQLYLRAADFGSPSLAVRRVTQSWTTSVTWNTQPGVTNVTYASTAVSSLTGYWYTWDLTTLVDVWVNGDDPWGNQGLILWCPSQVTFYRHFDSMNVAGTATDPRLVIDYTPPTPTPTSTPTYTSTSTRTRTPTATRTPTITSTPSNTPTGTLPPTLTPTNTVPPTTTPTATRTPPPTPTMTPIPTSTATPRAGSIGGRVWHDVDLDGVRDAGEPGLAEVDLILVRDGILLASDTTDINGNYLFSDLAAGAYTMDVDIWTVPPGYVLTAGTVPRVVILGDGENRRNVDFGYAAAPTPTPPPPSTVDLFYEGWEWVQVHGSFNPSLVAGKRTVVRVYVGVRGTDAPVSGVTGRLLRVGIDNWNTALRSDNSITVDPDEDPITDNREDLNGTLNFTLPADWRSGSYTANVWINYGQGVDECPRCEDNNIGTGFFNFYETRPLEVVMIRVWAQGLTPSRDDRGEMIRWLQKVYPIDEVNIYDSGFDPLAGDFDYTDTTIGGCGLGWEQLNASLWWINFWTDDPVDNLKYYGYLHQNVNTGNTNGCGYTPGDEASGKVAPGTIAGGRTMAHEIAHNIGREHSPDGLAGDPDPNYPVAGGALDVYGLDPATMTLFPAASTFDLMTYTNPRWISAYNYGALFRHFNPGPMLAEATDPSPLRAAPRAAADGNYLIVAGWMHQAQVHTLEPFYRLTLPPGSHDQPGSGAYGIEVQDAAGALLFSRAFAPAAHGDGSGNEGAFHEVVPFPATAARIVIKHGSATLAARVTSANSPTVTLLSPNGGETWAADGSYTVRWSAQDADGDPLVYSLQYSRDAGATWQALATNLAATQYTVHAATLGGTQQALLRVLVSDGLLTGTDDSNATFSVARKPPDVFVVSPEEGDVFAPGQLVELEGQGSDLEDGPLGDSALSWRSDRQGELGTGRHLALSGLVPGVHHLTLQGTDRDGMTASATVTIYVLTPRVMLPLVRR